MKLTLPDVWKQGCFHFAKKLRDRIFPSLRPPAWGLIESTTFLQEVFMMRKPPFLSIKLLLLGIPEQRGDPRGWASDGNDKIGVVKAPQKMFGLVRNDIHFQKMSKLY